jgi:hypothetical protein
MSSKNETLAMKHHTSGFQHAQQPESLIHDTHNPKSHHLTHTFNIGEQPTKTKH